MKINAVFEGGGVKGIALIGAVCCLEDRGYKFENLAGTSAGSIVASLLAVGYSGKELKEIVEGIDYANFLDKSIFDNFKIISLIGKTIGFIKDKGIYSGNPIYEYIEKLLQKKGKTKFKDVSRDGKSYLKIIASDVTRGEILILPDDLILYGIDPMEFSIATAVRMSISIPLIFKPVKVKYKDNISLIVDGGLLSNYPIWIFDGEGTPPLPTIGLKLTEKGPTLTSRGKTDLISYILDIFSAAIYKNEETYVKHKDWVRTIAIPTLGLSGLEFNKISILSLKLFQSGYKSAEEFLKYWNYQDYKKRFAQ